MNVISSSSSRDPLVIFDSEEPCDIDELKFLADTMIVTTHEVITKIEAIGKRLDATHCMLGGYNFALDGRSL